MAKTRAYGLRELHLEWTIIDYSNYARTFSETFQKLAPILTLFRQMFVEHSPESFDTFNYIFMISA